MMVPATIGERDEPRTGLHQPTGKQHPGAGLVATIAITHRGWLCLDVERRPGVGGTNEVKSSLVEAIHRPDVVGIDTLVEVGVHEVEHFATTFVAGLVDSAGEIKVADLESPLFRA
jgi:hypothetical protein